LSIIPKKCKIVISFCSLSLCCWVLRHDDVGIRRSFIYKPSSLYFYFPSA